MSIVQVTDRFALPPEMEDYREHRREQVRERFGLELIKALENGGIVGPIHEQVSEQEDWLWNSGLPTITLTMYAHVTDLPEPEEYRLMGGPADGRIARTGGAPRFMVPVLPPLSASPFDVKDDMTPRHAEYERHGDSNVYIYRRIAR